MRCALLFLLLWVEVACSSCHRHRSSCNNNGTMVTGYGLDVRRNDTHYITEMIEYTGISLASTCSVSQDFFIAKRFLVHNYTVDSEGGVDANVLLEGVYVYIEDPEPLRSKRVKCSFTYDYEQMVRLDGIECLYEGRNIFADYLNEENVTHYRLGSVERKYVLSESDTMLQLVCTDCNCRLSSGTRPGQQILRILGILCAISIGLSLLERLVYCACK
ncbi:hypothetical protein WA577_003807, partial [Blastocystis sp. JDR]